MKSYTIDSFKENPYNKENNLHIKESAILYPGNTSENINTSFILTKLIQEAGRWCRSHASDLFIWWTSFEENLNYESLLAGDGTVSFLFGFHERGVDNAQSICNKYNSAHPSYLPRYEYRSIFRLDVTSKLAPDSELGAMCLEMDLYEVER